MSENFKKFKGGPTPAAHNGAPDGMKTTGGKPSHHPHGQDPHLAKHPGRSTKHSPPVTPHHTSNYDWVKPSGELHQRPMLGPLARPWSPLSHPMNHGQGGQQQPQGSRYLKGNASARPNMEQPAVAQAHPSIPMKVGMTKKVRGKIGKIKRARSAYP